MAVEGESFVLSCDTPAWATPANGALPGPEIVGLGQFGAAYQAGNAADSAAFVCLVVADVSGFVEQIRQPDLPGVLCYQQLDCACSKPVGSCQETDKPWQCSVLRLDLARGLAGSLFYDRYTVIIFQDIDDGLEELILLAHQLKLLLKLFDPLLWSERFGVRHRATPLGPNRRPLAPILPTMLAQPYQNRRPALDAIPHLGLLVGHLSLSSDENSIWRGTPSTYKSSCQSVLGLRLLRNSSRA